MNSDMAINTAQSTARKRGPLSSFLTQEAITGYLFILPAMIGFTTFVLLPVVRGAYISLTNWNLLRDADFVGLENYQALANDPAFWNALRTTALYVIYNIPFQTVIGLFLAVAMDRLTKSMFVRGALILPYLLSNVIAAMIWLWLLDPLLGMVNGVMGVFGIPHQAFIGSPDLAQYAARAIANAPISALGSMCVIRVVIRTSSET